MVGSRFYYAYLLIFHAFLFHPVYSQDFNEIFRQDPSVKQADSLLKYEKFKSALDLYSIGEKKFLQSKNYPAYIYCLNQQSRCYLKLNQFDQSEKNIMMTLSRGNSLLGPNHYEMSNTYYDLGSYYRSHQDSLFYSARPAFLKAFDLSRQLPVGHLYRIHSYHGLAAYYWDIDDYNTAKYYYELALKEIDKNDENMRSELAYTYLFLGSSYRSLGAVQRGQYYLTMAVSIFETIPGQSPTNAVYANGNLANAYYNIGEFDTAKKYFFKAIAGVKDSYSSDLIRPLANLGTVYTELQQFDSAGYYFKKAMKIKVDGKRGSQSKLSDLYLQYSDLLLKVGNLDSSKLFIKKSIIISTELYGSRGFAIARLYKELALVDLALSNFDSSKLNIQKALLILEPRFKSDNIRDNPDLETSDNFDALYELLATKASIYFRCYKINNNPDDWTTTYLTYILIDELTDKIRNGPYTELTKLIIAKVFKKVASEALICLSDREGKSYSEEVLNLAFKFMEKNRYATIYENLSKIQARSQTRIPDSLYQLQNNISMQIKVQQYYLSQAKSDSSRNKINEKILILDNKFRSLQDSIQKKYGSFYSAFSKELISIEQVKDFLKPGQQFIEYFQNDTSLFILSISKNATNLYNVPWTDDLDQALDHFLNLLSNIIDLNKSIERIYDDYKDCSYKIYNQVLAGVVEKDINSLLISSDGRLANLPFEALITEDGKSTFKKAPYLITHFNIGYTYSLNLLYKFKPKEKSGQPTILALSYSDGNENLAKANRAGVNEIPATAREVVAISKIFNGKNDDFVIGENATETTFKKLAEKYEIVHLAVHGVGDTIEAINSRLLFKSSLDSLNDGNLYAYELYNLDFSKMRLAVLSGCETGIGKQYPGEGVFSIARGFAYAGCPAIVMSLWRVNDKYSAELMESFYKNLDLGLSKDEAMRNAKLAFINNSLDSRFAFPYFWSGFVVQGDSAPIRSAPFNYYLLLWLILPALAIVYFTRNRK